MRNAVPLDGPPLTVAALSRRNFDRLRLVPVGAGQFGTAANVDYPAPDAPAPPDRPMSTGRTSAVTAAVTSGEGRVAK